MKPKRNAVLNKGYRRAVDDLLHAKGLSPYALAQKLGWSESLMYYRLARIPRMRLELLKSLADTLEIDVVDLIKKLEEKNGTENL
jgi:ribosome-binding protein aMBF1 (putative translation factor)